MNRAQRRRFNKIHKTSFDKKDFDVLQSYIRIREGNFNLDDILLTKDYINVDNEELVPEGTEVKLNSESLLAFAEKNNLTPTYIEWVKANTESVFHITREQGRNSLVCLKEDIATSTHSPWLFNIYTDLLYYDDVTNNWVSLIEYEKNMNNKKNIKE